VDENNSAASLLRMLTAYYGCTAGGSKWWTITYEMDASFTMPLFS
jgi:hypothetical protein